MDSVCLNIITQYFLTEEQKDILLFTRETYFCGGTQNPQNHTDFLTEEQKDILLFTRETYFWGGTQNPQNHTDFFDRRTKGHITFHA